MEIALYYAPFTCAMAPYITLTEAKADFEVRPLNFRKKQQMSPEYMKLNPKHKVPLLVVDGKTLTENAAIHSWVAHAFPQAKILPEDPWQRCQAISLLSFCSSGIHPYLSRINNPGRVCDDGSEANVVAHAAEHLFEALGVADGLLAGREYFFDHFTAPDAHFFWCFRRATQFAEQHPLDLAQFKNCTAHFERMQTRDSVKKLLAFEKSVLDEFAKAA